MIRAVLNAATVKARLLAMSEKARKRAYQVSLRRAAAPVVKDLQRAWAAAKRRRGLVTGEIADGQQARIRFARKGSKAGTATLEIGANYRVGGYVKLWHILENGFRHYSKNATYATLGNEVNSLKRRRNVFFAEQVAAAGGRPRGKDARKALYSGIRAAWQQRLPGADEQIAAAQKARTGRREAARAGGSRRIAGRRISRPIAEKHVQTIAREAQRLLVAEVMRPVKGARRAA